MDRRQNDELGSIASRQHGLVSAGQLRALGLSTAAIRRLVASGRLRARPAGVYALLGTTPSSRQDAMAAALAGGPQALVAHRAAAVLWARGRHRGRSIEILLPLGSHRPSGPWRCHETRRLGPADIARVDGIPVTSVERTLIDVGRYWPADRVGRFLDDAVAAGDTSYDAFAERVAALRRRGQPGIAVARQVLADREVTEGTPFEQAMRRLLRTTSLPEAVREHPVVVGSRLYFVDFAFPEARLGIECDSLTWHTLPYQMDAHLRRQNDIQGTGMLLLRYTRRRLREEAADVAEEIVRHHQERTAGSVER